MTYACCPFRAFHQRSAEQFEDVRVALSINDEWNAVTDDSILTQGCIVARMDTENVDAIISQFLAGL